MKQYFKYFLTAATVLQGLALHAQQGAFYAGVTGGLSLPMGNFAKTEYDNNKSGFAAAGYNAGVTGTYYISKHFGITALASYTSYGFKGAQNLADGYKEAFGVDSATAYVKGNNHTVNIMAGPCYTVPFKKFAFDFRVLGGLVNASLAGNEVFLEDNSETTFSQKSATATTAGLQAGAGIRYAMSKNWGISFNMDYYYSKPDFTIDNVNRSNAAGRKITAYNEPVMGLNTNLSLVYKLKH